MKRLFISAILFPAYLTFSAATIDFPIEHFKMTAIKWEKKLKYDRDYENLVTALTWVESQWNPNAVGDAMDYGLFQITPIRLADYNKKTNSHYKMQDMFNPEISRTIFDFYSYGLPIEEAARRWNRAFQWQDSLGTKYWNKVQNKLNNLAK